MSWIQVYSGGSFDPAHPLVEEVSIVDIAHSLSQLCRFTGHSRSFYSVAQHSVLVSQNVPAGMELAGLLHDTAEAYLGDMSAPVKRLFPDFEAMELRVLAVIAAKYKLTLPFPPEVFQVDKRMVMTERREVLLPSVLEWRMKYEPYDFQIIPAGPAEAEKMFLTRFFDLWERQKP